MGVLTFCGACGTVTGSLYLLESGRKKILIDCGLYQGLEADKLNFSFPFDPEDIDYVILTHAHLDHSGRLLELVRDGFRGKIFTVQATIELLQIVLEDRLHLEPRIGPKELASDVISRCHPVEYDETFGLPGGIRFRLRDAGHILGSAHLELWCEGQKFAFSGDIGRTGTPIIRDPSPPDEADFLIMESTYGGRRHPPLGRAKRQLKLIIERAQRENARVFIPSFAIGRAQELLYYFNELVESGEIEPLPVILDSPMALKVTRVYARHTELYDEEALEKLARGDRIFSFPLFFSTASSEASRRIEELSPPYVVIAGSGMVTGGRIIDHLKRHLPERNTFVVFVGFQAKGTPGREILHRRPWVKLDHELVENRARIFRIEAFSAHADHRELLSWLDHFDKPPHRIFLTHGEPEARDTLKRDIQKRFRSRVETPSLGRQFVF
ncbi:MAG: MBL fold metallo-hydrolase [Thermodesulfobacteria bacterium]|nr:MBL fold metallo-hydrolase [Thermodesulfobacteriota bacterium]